MIRTSASVARPPAIYSIDGTDAGFDPIDHTKIDPRLGTWDDLRMLGKHVEIMADLIVNHVSSRSPQFLDYYEHGGQSRYAAMFLTYTSVFGNGARESDLIAPVSATPRSTLHAPMN